jgi:hypothetical protein
MKIKKLVKNNKALSEVFGAMIILTMSVCILSGMIAITQTIVDKAKADINGIGNENHKPIYLNIYPPNEATGIDSRPFLHVTVLDTDSDYLTITFIMYNTMSTDTSINSIKETFTIHSGDSITCRYNTAILCGKTYYWSIILDDGFNIVKSEPFNFSLTSLCTP